MSITIKALASGSSGNCYWISDSTTPILIEAGISIDRIRKGVDFKLSEIQGCLCSHAHADHSKSIKKLMDAGIDCYMSQPTAEALKVEGHRLHAVSDKQIFNVGAWAVRAFDVEHDCEGALGFYLISHGESLLYLTDTAYTKYRFNGINFLMLEANFDERIIRENVASGEVDRMVKRRTYANHMSIGRVLDFLKANDLSKCAEIYLLHLSQQNSDALDFKKRVQELTGIPTYIA